MSCPVLKMDVWMFVLSLLLLIQVNTLKLKQLESEICAVDHKHFA